MTDGAPNQIQVWRWIAIFLSGIVITMLSFWMVEARNYVSYDEVEAVVERMMGREEIMSELTRIRQSAEDARTRLRDLEDAVARLETVLEEARR